jgi:fructose-1,6-bisphosphatase/inositol monophosphatase family enzyme
MEIDYKRITDFMLDSGKRILAKAGNIKDIGITKKDLTEEDLAIERGFKEIIQSFGPEHILFAEEENAIFE